ncbi:hypothetical protein HYH03_003831 [Edaphochlamys debaryana]|uniref:Uncharacterized protein n=1 Tax=Edaphochlamys debaryana TaxID=47281 RepID=A0A836C2J3_9CHLO|nr:hypothetical protein HYH03_003831 [Edaphochlamys debaryana]|eukprot:KAG2498071.1 hypothetical protein HYH03_003831 [Edaphochlamys debaryana]
MPPQGRGRGGSAGGGAGRAGSAASADPGAGPSTSGRSGPASQLSILPAPLLEAYRALPAAAEALLPTPATQRPGGGSSAAGRGRGAGSGRLAALRGAKDRLWDFGLTVLELPNRSSPEQAAALAELLSTHPAETAALLRLYSAALRPDGEGEGSGGSGSGSGRGTGGGGSGSGGGGRGAGSSAAVEALAIKGWRAGAADCVVYVLGRLSPLPCSPHALSVLRFVLALLRTQALPALSRRLAAVTQAAAISEDSARDILRHAQTLLATLNGVLLTGAETSRAHSAEVASLHATGWGAPCGVVPGGLAAPADAAEGAAAAAGGVAAGVVAAGDVYGGVRHAGRCGGDLDALPPAPPPEVAAALAAGLLPALATLSDLPRSGSVKPCSNPFEDLLNACDLVRPGGSGLALFLAPLLVYGEPGQAEGLLGALGRGLEAERGGGKGGPESTERLQRAAASLLGALAGALQRCRRLGPAAAEAPAGPAEDSGAWEAPEAGAGAGAAGDPSGAGLPSPPLQQLRRLVAYASEQWGLPLPVLDGAAGSSGGGAEGQGS